MELRAICKNYFNGFQEIRHCSKNSPKINALALLKIISYFTGILPACFAVLYGLSLCGRVHKKPKPTPTDDKVDVMVQNMLNDIAPEEVKVEPPEKKPLPAQGFPSILVVRDYPGDLSEDRKKKMRAEFQNGQLWILFEDYPHFHVSIRRQDIFASGASVIVNAANTHLGGGGGIDGAIHDAGGNGYAEAHRALKDHYQSKYTEGYAALIKSGALKGRGIENVIVVAGPMGDSSPEKESQLYSCYYNSLLLAHQQNKESIAFPSISTGIFNFPKDRAANISLRAIDDFLKAFPRSSIKTISIHFLPREPLACQEEYEKVVKGVEAF